MTWFRVYMEFHKTSFILSKYLLPIENFGTLHIHHQTQNTSESALSIIGFIYRFSIHSDFPEMPFFCVRGKRPKGIFDKSIILPVLRKLLAWRPLFISDSINSNVWIDVVFVNTHAHAQARKCINPTTTTGP